MDLADRDDRCLAAIDGDGCPDPASLHFAAWLAGWWRHDGPSEPPWSPDAISIDQRGIQVMRWYGGNGTVRGYVPGARGCYVVAAGAVLPVI